MPATPPPVDRPNPADRSRPPIINSAPEPEPGHLQYLAALIVSEVDECSSRRIARRISEARFPRTKRLADFQCEAAPTVSPAIILTLAAAAYLDSGELVSRRCEGGAIILTSNKSYRDWGSLFPDVALAWALLDRLLHHATTIKHGGTLMSSRTPAWLPPWWTASPSAPTSPKLARNPIGCA